MARAPEPGSAGTRPRVRVRHPTVPQARAILRGRSGRRAVAKVKPPKHLKLPTFGKTPGQPSVGQPGTPSPGYGSTPGTPLSGDISRVRSYNDLQQQANQDINNELSGELQPLQSGLSGLDTREGRARQEISGLFGELEPYATDSAKRMRDFNDQTMQTEKNIVAATSARLNSLRQSQAQEAQQLAQQMGGPVAMDAFTGGVDPAIQEQAGLGAGGLLYSADIGAGAVHASEDFAGRVLPAIYHEDLVTSHNKFEDQRKTIQDQITSLQQSKSSKVNSRLNDLMGQERSYALQKTQAKLEQLKANRDWRATQQTLKNDQARLGLARGQFGLQQAGVSGRYKGKPTVEAKRVGQEGQRIALEAIRLTQQQKHQAAELGISNAKMKEQVRSHMENEKVARGRLANAQQSNAIHLVDALTNPTSNRPVTVTKKRYIPNDSPEALNAIRGKGQYYYDSKKKMYYHYDKVSMSQSQYARSVGAGAAVTDPNELYHYLVQNGVPQKMAVGVVRTKTNRPKWKP